MKKEKRKTNKAIEKAKEGYKKNFGEIFALAFVFFLICLICISPIFLGLIFVFLTIGLIMAPSFLSLQANLPAIIKGEGLSHKRALSYFGGYFQSYFGIYRLLIGFLKALGIGMAFFALAYFLGFAIFYPTNAIFKADVDSFLSLISQNKASQAYDLLYSSSALSYFLAITSSIGVCFGTLTFFHHFYIHSMNAYVRGIFINAGRGFSQAVFRSGYSKLRRAYLKDHFSSNWLFYVLLPASFILGTTLVLLFTSNLNYVLAGGLAMEALFFSFYSPYFLLWLGEIKDKYAKRYYAHSITMLEETLARMRLENVAPEIIEGMENSIAQAKKSLEEEESKDKGKSENEKSPD